MESYRHFVPITLFLAPHLLMAIAEDRIGGFTKSKGIERNDLSNDEVSIYALDFRHYREFVIRGDEVNAARFGAKNLPEVMVIGLMSTYDAFLSDLMRAIAKKQPKIFLTVDKAIKFSDLTSFSSIEEAKISLIDNEIEAVIRESHHEQFDWMQKRFAIELKKDLPIWPRFVELCERRNLFTHTGGIVSKQYQDICKEHKCDLTDITIGQKLTVNAKYFEDAVNIIYEIGVKLCHVFWRKFAKDEREEADESLNELGYDLIYSRAYTVAESVLNFGVNILKTHANDSTRRMMVVNLANAVRLQDRKEEATKIVDKEDWSACDNRFRLCAAAVKGELDHVVELVRLIGPVGRPRLEEYRTWPVFRGLRTEEKFLMVIEEVFGEALITDTVRADIPQGSSTLLPADEDIGAPSAAREP